MSTNLRDLEIEEISILGKDSRPAVRAARIAIFKRDGGQESPVNSFDNRVQEIRKRDNCSALAAMTKARKEYPADFERYQAAGCASSRPIQKLSTQSGAVRNRSPDHGRTGNFSSRCDDAGAASVPQGIQSVSGGAWGAGGAGIVSSMISRRPVSKRLHT